MAFLRLNALIIHYPVLSLNSFVNLLYDQIILLTYWTW